MNLQIQNLQIMKNGYISKNWKESNEMDYKEMVKMPTNQKREKPDRWMDGQIDIKKGRKKEQILNL